jgi:hypothetical protein
MGIRIVSGKHDLKAKQTRYELAMPGGKSKSITADELKTLIYDSAK